MEYRKREVFYILMAISIVAGGFLVSRVVAEQSGSSPESGSTSRLNTASTAVAALSYGSTATGTWGDWGTMWNRVYSAAREPFNDAKVAGTKNGTGAGSANCTDTFALNCFTKAKGGVDDWNGASGNLTPTDAYYKTWITCDDQAWSVSHPGGNRCNTGRSVAEMQDPNTGLVWSPRITINSVTSVDWFSANNCQQPSNKTFNNGTANTLNSLACTNTGDGGCICNKEPVVGGETKTGCEAYDDGNWRLPYQKELMQSYIDGSRANLTNATSYYWSSTTVSISTQNAWNVYQYNGYTLNTTKTGTGSVRCVR